MSKKIELKTYFEKNLKEIPEFKFLQEFYSKNLGKIIKKDSDTLDKLGDKLLQIIVVFEGDYKIKENNLEFLLDIIQSLIDNLKIKIGYIILLNPILEFLINIKSIQVKDNSQEEKEKSFQKEKENLLFNLDSILEKNFMKVKYAPYLIELIDIYNEANINNEQINHFWLHSFIYGSQDILDKISKYYQIENITLENIEEKLNIIKNKK